MRGHWGAKDLRRKHTNRRWQKIWNLHRSCIFFFFYHRRGAIQEYGSRQRTDVWRQRYRQICGEKTANSRCPPLSQKRFWRYRSWTRQTTVSSGRVVVIVQFILLPHPQGRWQDGGRWRVKGQSPRVAETKTHTKRLHQYYINHTCCTISQWQRILVRRTTWNFIKGLWTFVWKILKNTVRHDPKMPNGGVSTVCMNTGCAQQHLQSPGSFVIVTKTRLLFDKIKSIYILMAMYSMNQFIRQPHITTRSQC